MTPKDKPFNQIAVVVVVGLIVALGAWLVLSFRVPSHQSKGVPHDWLGSSVIAMSHQGLPGDDGVVDLAGFRAAANEFRRIAPDRRIYIETDIRLVDVAGQREPLLLAVHDVDGALSVTALTMLDGRTLPVLVPKPAQIAADAGEGDIAFVLVATPDSSRPAQATIDRETRSVIALNEVNALPHDLPAVSLAVLPALAEVHTLLTDLELQDVLWNFELKGVTSCNSGDDSCAAKSMCVGASSGCVPVASRLATELDRLDAKERVCLSFGDTRNQSSVAIIRETLGFDSCYCTSFPEKSADFDIEFLSFITRPFREPVPGRASCTQLLHQLITERDVREAHDAGLVIHAWEVEVPDRLFGVNLPSWFADVEKMDEKRMHELLNWGVDGINTDNVDLLLQVLADREAG